MFRRGGGGERKRRSNLNCSERDYSTTQLIMRTVDPTPIQERKVSLEPEGKKGRKRPISRTKNRRSSSFMRDGFFPFWLVRERKEIDHPAGVNH